MEHRPRTAQELVEHEVHRWAIEAAERRGERARPAVRPVVTISREYGALGADLGARVAARMGFSLWDQEIVHAIADQAGVREALLSALDERARGAMEQIVDTMLTGESYAPSDYLRQLMRVVRTVARHGAAVLVGRGANFVLGPAEALRVRVVRPLEDRIRRIAERSSLDERTARAEVERTERERAAFIRRHYDRDVGDPMAYDLVVNTGTIPVDRAVDVVVAAFDARFGAPKAG